MRIKLVTALAAIALSSGTAYAQDFPTITLSAHQVERLGITVQTVEKANSVALFELVGRVMRAPDGTATVVAPFAGTITKIHVPGARSPTSMVFDPVTFTAALRPRTSNAIARSTGTFQLERWSTSFVGFGYRSTSS